MFRYSIDETVIRGRTMVISRSMKSYIWLPCSVTLEPSRKPSRTLYRALPRRMRVNFACCPVISSRKNADAIGLSSCLPSCGRVGSGGGDDRPALLERAAQVTAALRAAGWEPS